MDDAEVSKASFTIAYNGDDRTDDHTMDVELLAPALMGFGKLIREANAEFNGDRAKAMSESFQTLSISAFRSISIRCLPTLSS